MSRRVALLALSGSILVLAVASCGRYGKPVRSAPAPPSAEQPAQGAAEEDAQSASKR